jgi:hypothetical protein
LLSQGAYAPAFNDHGGAPRLRLGLCAPPTYARTLAGAEVPSPRALVLAHEIVAAENAADRFSRMWSNSPDIIWIQIIRALGVDDPALGQKIRVLVATNLETIGAEIAEVRVQALVQTYTVGEMEGMLAFRRSPVGQAYYLAAPDLSRARQAMSQGSVPKGRDADAPALSPRRLDLIRRILAAQDEKGQARKAG